MKLDRTLRIALLALLLVLVPAASQAGVFISVGFAPPVLPVYAQPMCPGPGMIWTPGYWAYGEDGYYWVPGAWVPAPYMGALWTPGYWGWSSGFYMWHPGYWGRHVGYYGGVNYGFGYGGIGFVGGAWRGGAFAYNTAVMNVNTTVIHNTYVDRTVVERNTIVNNHVAYSGGPGGVNHLPTADERVAEHEQHMAPTGFQSQHESSFRGNPQAYARNNGGRPQNPALSRPLGGQTQSAPGAGARPAFNSNAQNGGNLNRPNAQGASPAATANRPAAGQSLNQDGRQPQSFQHPNQGNGGGTQPQFNQHVNQGGGGQPYPNGGGGGQAHPNGGGQPHPSGGGQARPGGGGEHAEGRGHGR